MIPPEDPTDPAGDGPVAWQPDVAGPATLAQSVLAGSEAWLLGIAGVTSVGVGASPAGDEVIVIGVQDEATQARLPPQVQGVPVVVEITGPIEALRGR